jgi:hypothetical protein
MLLFLAALPPRASRFQPELSRHLEIHELGMQRLLALENEVPHCKREIASLGRADGADEQDSADGCLVRDSDDFSSLHLDKLRRPEKCLPIHSGVIGGTHAK